MKLRFEAFLNNKNVKEIRFSMREDFVIVEYKDSKEVKLYSPDNIDNPMFFKTVCNEWNFYKVKEKE